MREPELPPREKWPEPRGAMVAGLFLLALFYTLYLARDFFLPIVLAVLLNFLLSPAVRSLRKIRIREEIGAGVLIATLLGVFTYGFYQLSAPASEWLATAPETLRSIQADIGQWRKPMQQVSRAAEEVEKITGMNERRKVPQVEIRQPGLSESLLAGTRSFVATVSVLVLLLYFLLASGDMFLRKLIKVLPTLRDKKTAVEIATSMERQISVYLVSVTAINTGLGVVEGVAMYFLGLPNPVLWGLMAAVLNFVPYLGALVGTTIVSIVGYLTFGGVPGGILAGGVYMGITAIEGGLISPMILAKRLTLNPVVLLIGVVFWGWLWGIPGALLAVPLMSSIKIFCDNIDQLAPLGEFMGR